MKKITMNHSNVIEHDGLVEEVSENGIKVLIVAQSACASCHAKGACTVSDTEDKLIDVPYTSGFHKGERVSVLISTEMGFKALFLAYVLPFLLLLITLIVSLELTEKELLSGILSISILVPYYLTLYFLRKAIQKKFTFQIKKQ